MNNRKTYDNKVLVEGIILGDEKAFRAIFDHYKDKLFSYCFKFTKSEELAEEIVHDVLMKIWTDRKNLNPHLSFNAYLYKITRNLTLSFLKKSAADEMHKERLGRYFEKVHNQTEDHIIYADFKRIAEKAIASLSPQRKLIYRMSRDEELTHEEIAAILGISKHTVRNHMVEALKSIKNYFQIHADMTISVGYFLFLSLPS